MSAVSANLSPLTLMNVDVSPITSRWGFSFQDGHVIRFLINTSTRCEMWLLFADYEKDFETVFQNG